MFFWYTADDASFLEIEYNGILVCFSLLMPIQTMIAKFLSTNPRKLPEERFVFALFSCVLAGLTINMERCKAGLGARSPSYQIRTFGLPLATSPYSWPRCTSHTVADMFASGLPTGPGEAAVQQQTVASALDVHSKSLCHDWRTSSWL